MNAYAVILKPAKLALTLFAISVIIGIAIVVGIAQYRNIKEQSIKQTDEQLAGAREQIRKLTYDLDSITRLAKKYQHLNQLGFIGEADRDAWVQRLEAIYRDTRLPPTLRYTLAPPQPMNQPPESTNAAYNYQKNVLHHTLSIEITGIHEVEFLDFITRLDKNWRVPYRVDTCQIARGEKVKSGDVMVESGLQITCTLQIFSLPAPTPAKAVQ